MSAERGTTAGPQPGCELLACCQLCLMDGERFRVPWDNVGGALLAEHLRQQHGLTLDVRKP